MNIFKSPTYTWWQLGLLKVAFLLIGIAIGATWNTMFLPYAIAFVVVGTTLGIYLGIVWFRQCNENE